MTLQLRTAAPNQNRGAVCLLCIAGGTLAGSLAMNLELLRLVISSAATTTVFKETM